MSSCLGPGSSAMPPGQASTLSYRSWSAMLFQFFMSVLASGNLQLMMWSINFLLQTARWARAVSSASAVQLNLNVRGQKSPGKCLRRVVSLDSIFNKSYYGGERCHLNQKSHKSDAHRPQIYIHPSVISPLELNQLSHALPDPQVASHAICGSSAKNGTSTEAPTHPRAGLLGTVISVRRYNFCLNAEAMIQNVLFQLMLIQNLNP